MTGRVITVTQSQYNMVRGNTSNPLDIEIRSGEQTVEGDIYIIPFISESDYFYELTESEDFVRWIFKMDELDQEDIILIDYPIGSLNSDQLDTLIDGDSSNDQLWDVSHIFEAGNCIWVDPYYIGHPLVSN